MPEETMWEVWCKSKITHKWMCMRIYPTYKEAKEYFNTRTLFKDYEARIVRAETHRCVVLEDLKGNVYAD